MDLIFEAPFNSLSFGNVSFNILKELFKRNVTLGLFPAGNIQLDAFVIEKDFADYIQSSINTRWKILKNAENSLKLWHLNGGENRKTPRQNLFTFYECSEPTEAEVSVCQSQNKTIFSSNYAKSLFETAGCSNCAFVPLGFDPDLSITGKKYLEGVIHFGLFGKFESRKRTKKIIQTWLKKYGNNNKYQLTCCVTNPFLKPEDMMKILADALEGKQYTNINFLPYLKTNVEMNEVFNAIDIDLTGLSGGEGWNLPSFNATCLGKWSIVSNNTSHKDWATPDNAILIEPTSTFPCEVGVFFAKQGDFNQGVFYDWLEDDCIAAMEKAEKLAGTKNANGLALAQKLSYKNTVDHILELF